MNFAFSRRLLENLVETGFQGEWKYLRKALFEISEQRAVDDEEDMSGYLDKTSNLSFGRLGFSDKPEKKLKLKDVSNKIIHASNLNWDFSIENNPILICNSQETEKWVQAEINVVKLVAFCGGLMS
jgi:hypothetical protein